jgi:hypothetical protein
MIMMVVVVVVSPLSHGCTRVLRTQGGRREARGSAPQGCHAHRGGGAAAGDAAAGGGGGGGGDDGGEGGGRHGREVPGPGAERS